MSAQVHVRLMSEDDALVVADLATELGYPSTAAAIKTRMADVVRRADGVLLVAVLPGGKVTGWIHVKGQHSLESDRYALIAGLVVDRTARRQGVGRSLIGAAEEWAHSKGYSVIRVSTNTTRRESRPFYEAAGYALLKTQYSLIKTLA